MNKKKTNEIEVSTTSLNNGHILHPATSIPVLERDGPLIIKSSSGMYVQDHSGHKALDGIAGLWCSNLGHGRADLANTLKEAAIELDYFHTFNGCSNEAEIQLSEKLIALAPDSLSHVFYGCSGSDANDSLVKIAWQYHMIREKPQKRKIISRWQAYHGTSISTASLTGLKSFHRSFNLPLDFVLHTELPHYYTNSNPGESEVAYTQRLLESIRTLIKDEGSETIAAFIGEPIMGAGGVIPPPKGYWQGVKEICEEHDVLLIMDEVVCGYGRTGKAFGSMHYDVMPDMMATAKGLTSGVFPMSAAFISADIHDVLREGAERFGAFAHGYTYSGHPIGAAVALKVMNIIENEEIIDNSRITGEYLHQCLQEVFASHEHVGEIRGKGLLAAIQLVQDKSDKIFYPVSEKVPAAITKHCYQNGLIARPLATAGSIALSPPLIASRVDVDIIVDRLQKGFDQYYKS